jgi:hypothetical protein
MKAVLMNLFKPTEISPSGRNLLNNSGCPPRTQVRNESRPVYGRKLISVFFMLNMNYKLSWNTRNGERFVNMWAFWESAKDYGVTREGIEARAKLFNGFIIGQRFKIDHTVKNWKAENSKLLEIDLCQDLELSLAIISRLVGHMFLPKRPSDFEQNHLFDSVFVTDDPRIQ